ncbi:hypothetical protein [Amycolatopsis sp. SID8362]|uniref:hypothetical protein n=1 Tax=Amycolatopsis sp. SID8362 TaxID=2690346 RepID=UPI00137125D6|nr:hypothetical protein [Amycolatopsis sp. SID8362]NBH04308.1 hypothetical protein [Amycolatopsis sp. SID8362]NED41007.1 hypothetical protein [Amycolatopsis sp. SID8362]
MHRRILSRRLLIAIFAISTILTSTITSTAGASIRNSEHQAATLPRHILDPKTCALPVSERTGAWLCPAAQKVLPSKIEKATFSPLDPPVYRDRYCWPGDQVHGSACWTVLDDFNGYFEMWSDFGTADEVYGQVSYAAEYSLVGSLVNVRPVTYNATFDTQGLTFEGNALDACGGQTGSAIPNAYGTQTTTATTTANRSKFSGAS